MNYYEARQILKDGKPDGWHYTVMNDGDVWPVGYCGRFIEAKPMFDKDGNRVEGGYFHTQESADAHNAKKDKYHGPTAHASAQEACDCYIEYQLDNLHHAFTKDKTRESDTKHKCEYPGCQSFETGYASIKGSIRDWVLCDEHNNREAIAKELLKKGNTYSSFGSY